MTNFSASWAHDGLRVLSGELPVFSSRWESCGFPPMWRRSVISGIALSHDNNHWTDISEFDLEGGDIKGYWELGRFDGLLILALAYCGTCKDEFRQGMEAWLESWSAENPGNMGVQWKCGQEAGLRMLQMILCADLLRRWSTAEPTPAFCDLVAQHCRRISPTILYAIAQNNNHGTSEAAALFIGGTFLVRHGSPAQRGRARHWQGRGRRLLENRIRCLVLEDGSFAQNSVNYHRLMLDTYSLAETLRQVWDVDSFSPELYRRCEAATKWLAAFTDKTSGDAPNLGPNDGARMFVMHHCAYRDFRPSVQWAAALFLGRRYYSDVGCNEPLHWLGLDTEQPTAEASIDHAIIWRNGGYTKLSSPNAWLLLRLPRYRFRPLHSDALHFDLWVEGENVLRDGGTYSYNTSKEWLDYFSGVRSHNTIQFDDRDQMPRISRFLYSDWLECAELDFSSKRQRVTASYRDPWGASHRRSVSMLGTNTCEVIDEIAGFAHSAVLRWRLMPLEQSWQLNEGKCASGRFTIAVESSVPVCRQRMIEGWESRFYDSKTQLSVFETEVREPGAIRTTMTW